MKPRMSAWPLAFVAPCGVVAACTSTTSTPPLVIPDSGNQVTSVADAGMDVAPDGGHMAEGGFTLAQAPAVDPSSLANGTLLLTASGEILALDGYNFPAINPGDGVFADGWEVRFSHYIATFDKVSLWANPDTSPT